MNYIISYYHYLWTFMDIYGYLWELNPMIPCFSPQLPHLIRGAAVAPSAMFRHMIPRPTEGSPLEPGDASGDTGQTWFNGELIGD